MPCSIARSVIITAGRCVENEPVRKNTDTEQPAFGRNAGVLTAGGTVFGRYGEPEAAAPKSDECALSQKAPEPGIPTPAG